MFWLLSARKSTQVAQNGLISRPTHPPTHEQAELKSAILTRRQHAAWFNAGTLNGRENGVGCDDISDWFDEEMMAIEMDAIDNGTLDPADRNSQVGRRRRRRRCSGGGGGGFICSV